MNFLSFDQLELYLVVSVAAWAGNVSFHWSGEQPSLGDSSHGRGPYVCCCQVLLLN